MFNQRQLYVLANQMADNGISVKTIQNILIKASLECVEHKVEMQVGRVLDDLHRPRKSLRKPKPMGHPDYKVGLTD